MDFFLWKILGIFTIPVGGVLSVPCVPSRSESAGRLVGHFDAVLQHLHREALRRHGREPKAETSGFREDPWEKMGNMEWNTRTSLNFGT
jgi:hypothetical protein